MENKSSAYKTLMGTLERKRPLRRPKRRWEYNINMGPKQIGWDWIYLGQDGD
jgi:hypothetical protein